MLRSRQHQPGVLAARVHQHQRGTSHGLDSTVINCQMIELRYHKKQYDYLSCEKLHFCSLTPFVQENLLDKPDESIAILHRKRSVSTDEEKHRSKHCVLGL
jgi:hypothetical protein